MAQELANRIVSRYFQVGFDGDTRQDIEQFLRNFIDDEQERYQMFLAAEETKDNLSEGEDEDQENDENLSDEEDENETIEFVPLFLLFTVARDLYEDYRKTAFISFRQFYNELLLPQRVP